MSAKSYIEKLRDPRWQKLRLEILQRDGWACVSCGSSENTLNVHHGFYSKNTDPWDYPPCTLHSLCDDCHADAEHDRMILYSVLAAYPPNEIWMLTELLMKLIKTIGFNEACSLFYLLSKVRNDDFVLWCESVMSLLRKLNLKE